MLLRLEAFGRYLQVQSGRIPKDEPPVQPMITDMPQPIVVYPDPPTDPVGFRIPQPEGH